MEIIILITLDLLFCILFGFGIRLDHRLTKLEQQNKLKSWVKEKELINVMSKELEALKERRCIDTATLTRQQRQAHGP
jgi:hypothetical protein